MIVYFQAGPCVKGCIFFLCVAEDVGFPVAQTLSFRDLLVEEDGVYLLQAGVFDAELPDIILQVQEVGGLYISVMQMEAII